MTSGESIIQRALGYCREAKDHVIFDEKESSLQALDLAIADLHAIAIQMNEYNKTPVASGVLYPTSN